VRSKTAHRPLKRGTYPLPGQPAQEQYPRGTRGGPLSAARFPAWHGSRSRVARDRSIITAFPGQTVQPHVRGPGFIPAAADCGYRAPLSPRL